MKHVKYFFTRKYLLFLLPVIIGIAISGYMMVTDGEFYDNNIYTVSHFVPEIQEYSSMEELESLLEKTRFEISFLGKDDEEYEDKLIKLLWYEYLYSTGTEYDTIASYEGSRKFTKFSMFDNFSEPVFILVYFMSVIAGALLITWDFQASTAKLIYSSGENRLKVLFSRYGISLAAFSALIIVIETVYALIASGVGGPSEIGLMAQFRINVFSFGEYAIISMLSVILNFWIVYTAAYFASAAFHNCVIPLCGAMIVFVFIMFIRNSGAYGSMWMKFLDSSVFGLVAGMYKNGSNPSVTDFLIYLVNVFSAAAIAVAGSVVFYKRDVL